MNEIIAVNVKMGWTVKDTITGFKGVLTGIATYLSGCSQGLVVPPLSDDGKMVDSHWFDIQRLVRVGEDIVELDNEVTPGCDKQAPKR